MGRRGLCLALVLSAARHVSGRRRCRSDIYLRRRRHGQRLLRIQRVSNVDMHGSWLLAAARRVEQLPRVRAVYDFSVLQNRSSSASLRRRPLRRRGRRHRLAIAARWHHPRHLATLSTTATAGKGDAGAPTRRH